MVSAWWLTPGAWRCGFLPTGPGLTTQLSKAMARHPFVPVHDRGRVLADVAVMLADGG
jgi:hypothetical protein